MTPRLLDLLTRARGGDAAVADLLRCLVTTDLVVPSGQEVAADGAGLRPVLYDKDGASMVACFTDLEGARRLVAMAPHFARVRGADLLRRIPAGQGLVVNPGLDAWFDLSPEGVVRAREAFVDAS